MKPWVRKYAAWMLLALSLMANLYIGMTRWLDGVRAKYATIGANQIIQNIMLQSEGGQKVTINLGGRLFTLTPQTVEKKTELENN